MAKTPSTMLQLGTAAPQFTLLEPTTNNTVALVDFLGWPVMIAFICNHCPYVLHIRERLTAVANKYQKKGITFIAINANDAENYPDDSPEKMVEAAKIAGYEFPYLYDADQSIAKAYQAACTPDLYLFDADHKLYYRGQFDASRPNNDVPVTGADLVTALEALLAGEASPAIQIPSLGCNIKWKAGNEPSYFNEDGKVLL